VRASRYSSDAYLVLDRELFSFSGADCGKIGTSYQAFQTQTTPCNQAPGSCLEGQLRDYAGKPEHTLSSHGLEQRFGMSRVEREVRSQQNTVVRVEVEAGQVRYIRSIAKIKIVEKWYEPERSGTRREIGVLVVVVGN